MADALDLDAIEAEARDHRRITDVGRHVLPLGAEVRRLRVRVAELEGPRLCDGCKKYPGSCMCRTALAPSGESINEVARAAGIYRTLKRPR